jgi:hypothetical protein
MAQRIRRALQRVDGGRVGPGLQGISGSGRREISPVTGREILLDAPPVVLEGRGKIEAQALSAFLFLRLGSICGARKSTVFARPKFPCA